MGNTSDLELSRDREGAVIRGISRTPTYALGSATSRVRCAHHLSELEPPHPLHLCLRPASNAA